MQAINDHIASIKAAKSGLISSANAATASGLGSSQAICGTAPPGVLTGQLAPEGAIARISPQNAAANRPVAA